MTTLFIEYWPPLIEMALPPNVHDSVGSVDDTVTNLMIIFLDAASTVTFGSSAKLGFTVAFASPAAAAAVVVVVVSAVAAAALNDVTAASASRRLSIDVSYFTSMSYVLSYP